MSNMQKFISTAVLVLAAALVLSLSGVGHQSANAAGSAPVTVMNTTSNPVPVAGIVVTAPQTPYSLSFYCWSSTDGYCRAETSIPAGKRFVIEYVSAMLLTSVGAKPLYLQMVTWDALVPSDPAASNSQARNFPIPVTYAMTGGDGDYYSASEKVLLVAEPHTVSNNGETVTFPYVYAGNCGDKALLHGVLTGYLQSLN